MKRVRVTTYSLHRSRKIELHEFRWGWLASLFALIVPMMNVQPDILVYAEVL